MVAVRFEEEQDLRKYMTGDTRERSLRIPAGNGEADAYFSFARRARQYVEGRKEQERYLCGPRLEAQITGRAEAAVEGCRPGWLSKEHGVKILLCFLKTRCAKLALPDTGSHLQELFFKLKREQYEPMASLSTRHRNEHTKVRRVIAGSDYLGFGKHGSKTYQAVLKLDPEYC